MSATSNVQTNERTTVQSAVLTWEKPAREQHAHIGEALANALEGLAASVSDLAHYLFRICIAGKLEELNLYTLPLGSRRTTDKRAGSTYSQNTLRSALFRLVERGLVIIDRDFGRGWFRLTVRHPGPTRPFEHTKPGFSKFRSFDQKIEKNGAETIEIAYPLTEDFTEAKQAPLAAAQNEVTAEEDADNKIPSDFHSPQNVTFEIAHDPQPDSPSAILSPEDNSEEAHWIEEVEDIDEAEETGELEDSDSNSNSGIKQPPQENPQAEQILRVVRGAMPINPQLTAEVLKYSLAEVVAAVNLYNERNAKPSSAVKTPPAFLTQALRERWAFGGVEKAASSRSPYPLELTQWYEWASHQGIVDGRSLAHCPLSSPGIPGNVSSDPEFLLVAVRCGSGFQFRPWRQAMLEFPIADRAPG